MSRMANTVERVTAELEELEHELAALAARVAGKRAELARLRESLAAEDRSGLPAARTDAIVAVLQREGGPMSPSEILEVLHAAGRSDEMRSVTATLAHLVKGADGRVERPSRGLYQAI